MKRKRNVINRDYIINEGIVVFLDALRTKGSWLRQSPKNVILRHEELVYRLKWSGEFLKSLIKGKSTSVKTYAFSDTKLLRLVGSISFISIFSQLVYTLSE